MMMRGMLDVRDLVVDGTGLSDEVTANDFVELGAMRVVLVIELGFGDAAAIVISNVGIFLQMRMHFLEHLVDQVVRKGVVSLVVMFE